MEGKLGELRKRKQFGVRKGNSVKNRKENMT